MKIVALATCHNRRQSTLRALGALQQQALPDGFELEICIVDDGSSDGTLDAVREVFASVVVLRGSGELYWAGGMRFGWDSYVKTRDPDMLLVFNDDIQLYAGAITTLLESAHQLEAAGCAAYVVSGAFMNPETGDVAYGGAVRNSWWHPLRFATVPPKDVVQECDTVNMNFSLISRAALGKIGFLASDFTHGMADYDFGLRLRRAGGRIVLAPGYVGECHVNPVTSKSLQSGLQFRERWRRLTGVKEQPLAERAAYFRRHGGWLWPLFFSLPYLRAWIESGAGALRRSLAFRRSD